MPSELRHAPLSMAHQAPVTARRLVSLAGATGDGLAEMLAGHPDGSSNAAQIAVAAGLSDEAV